MIRFNRFTSAELLLTAGMVAAGIGGAAPSRAETVPPHVPGRILVQFKPTTTAEQVRSLVASANAQIQGEIPKTGVKVLKLSANANDMAVMRAFAQRPEVRFAELDETRKPDGDVIPNDPWYTYAWHLSKIQGPQAWTYSTGSTGVVIAILDTGCDPAHPDLKPKYVSGWNIYDNNSNSSDIAGHGTAVAGTAAAYANNGTGVSSVAWNCRVMPIRITDLNATASFSSIAAGLSWAADHGARIANVSFNASNSSTVSSAAQYFQGKGGVVTMSAGNYSTFDSSKDNPFVLTISATDQNDMLASFSNTGNNVDLSAPGTSIPSTTMGGGYGFVGGTSYSAPIVAGVAALVISANPGLTGSQVQDVLKGSADDLGTAGWDTSFGWGRVNAAKALARSGSVIADTSPPSVTIGAPSDNSTITGTVTVQVTATDNVAVTSVTLLIDDVVSGTLSASPYSFSVDTTRLSNSPHTIKAVAVDPSGNGGGAVIVDTVSNVVDNTAPTVTIVSPANGQVSGMVAVTASASDNMGVSKVELYVDGKLATSDLTSPWCFSVNSKSWKPKSSHSLLCKAYDKAGNAGSSQTVIVTK